MPIVSSPMKKFLPTFWIILPVAFIGICVALTLPPILGESKSALVWALASLIVFIPSIIARVRRVQAFNSISALNALTILLLVSTPAWPWFFWVAVALWIAAATWAIMGTRLAC
jgi:hypothetical protein